MTSQEEVMRPPSKRAWYQATLEEFLAASPEFVAGTLTMASGVSVELAQRDAWLEEIAILRSQISGLSGHIFFEFTIPRMGTRVDVVLLIERTVFVLEFKVGESHFSRGARDQVWDYALDLKNFHEGSHDLTIVPILIATKAEESPAPNLELASDRVARPLHSTVHQLRLTIDNCLRQLGTGTTDAQGWSQAPYRPTPTIIEAARALFAKHSVQEIARHDAGAVNLRSTSKRLEDIILEAKRDSEKIICFVTGVPGAGKTLVGLNVATLHRRSDRGDHAVYLSGNGPLVAVLREALTRDEANRLKENGKRAPKARVAKPVKAFIQNVHHFRDEALQTTEPPDDHVVVFDEAQRAWNLRKTAQFMKQKKGVPDFNQSESAFLISYMDRHPDWAVIVCLVGGGQEIHTGEAGIGAWLEAAQMQCPHWALYISSQLRDSEYAAGHSLDVVSRHPSLRFDDSLHLAVSMRSFRAEHVSGFVKATLDCDVSRAQSLLEQLTARYPIAITRDLTRAKQWVRTQSRGTERYGMVASSKAMRLKPYAVDVRIAINPVHWFLDGPDDVRSSWYLEDCATEFQVQGLELDWVCVTWDADLRYAGDRWSHHDFRGKRWLDIHNSDNQAYLKNAYRVLMTRARQGMVVFVPPGDSNDGTRLPEYYDQTYNYLRRIGLPSLNANS